MSTTQLRQALHTVADALADLLQTPNAFGEIVETPVKVEVIEEEEPAGPTLTEVRAALADLARAGRAADVKAALGDLGVSKLSDVPEAKYQTLLDTLNG